MPVTCSTYRGVLLGHHLIHLFDGCVYHLKSRGLSRSRCEAISATTASISDTLVTILANDSLLSATCLTPLLDLLTGRRDERLDLFGGFSRSLRQRAHFRSDHRETPPRFPRARRFDARVERQQIGLESYFVDDADDIADLLR